MSNLSFSFLPKASMLQANSKYFDSDERLFEASLNASQKFAQSAYEMNQFSFHRSSSIPMTKLTVCLDLDNTLVYSTISAPIISDFIIRVDNEVIYVTKRPLLDAFLSGLSQMADLYLFTSSKEEYATQILENIDPFDIYFKKVLQ